MVKILSIETSTAVCSVAIHLDGKLSALLEITESGAHSERLMGLIEEVMEKAAIAYKDLDAIAVSEGPGSYTGLRIGVSTAKGLALGLNKPLIAVNTLQALSSASPAGPGELTIPVLDARRMEVYREVFDRNGNSESELQAEILSTDSFQNFLVKGRVYFLGDAVEKVKSIIRNENAVFLEDLTVSAKHMGSIAYGKYQKGEFADIAYLVPNYLKEFKALHSKKNPLLSL